MNRGAALHNIRILCPTISHYVINTYRFDSNLYISGGGEFLSKEGTTQGDPLAMPWYSMNTNILITALKNSVPQARQVWLADDASAGGKLDDLNTWYDELVDKGEKFG